MSTTLKLAILAALLVAGGTTALVMTNSSGPSPSVEPSSFPDFTLAPEPAEQAATASPEATHAAEQSGEGATVGAPTVTPHRSFDPDGGTVDVHNGLTVEGSTCDGSSSDSVNKKRESHDEDENGNGAEC